MNLLESILAQVTTATAVVAVIACITQVALAYYSSRTLEKFKSKLVAEASAEFLAYRTAVEKEQIRLQIAYAGVYKEQSDTILELYKLLTQFERLMYLAATPANENPHYKAFIETWNRLMEVYDQRQVLLPDYIDEQFGQIAKSIYTAVHNVRRVEDRIDKTGTRLSQEQIDRLFKSQDAAHEILNRIPELKAALKAHLRRLLGVHHSEEQAQRAP
jgi:hypothetical protein